VRIVRLVKIGVKCIRMAQVIRAGQLDAFAAEA
jgi:hypothetical protein